LALERLDGVALAFDDEAMLAECAGTLAEERSLERLRALLLQGRQ
jgi:hypothetical protein